MKEPDCAGGGSEPGRAHLYGEAPCGVCAQQGHRQGSLHRTLVSGLRNST